MTVVKADTTSDDGVVVTSSSSIDAPRRSMVASLLGEIMCILLEIGKKKRDLVVSRWRLLQLI